MKVLLMAQFYPPVIGGEERHVRNLAHGLAERGHDVQVLTHGDSAGSEVRDGIVVHTVRPTTARLPFLYQEEGRVHAAPLPDPSTAAGIRGVIAQFRPDVVHAHNWVVNSLLPQRHRVPFVLTLHDYSHACATKRLMEADVTLCPGPSVARCVPCTRHHYKGPSGPLIYAANLAARGLRQRRLDKILVVSRAVGEGNGLQDSGLDWEVLPNFVPDALLVPQPPGPPPEGFVTGGYWLFVGDLSPDKGVPVLLAAYAALPEGRPPLLLVGRRTFGTPEEDTLPAGASYGVAWAHSDVVRAQRHAQVAVAPSVWPDPCPTVVLEAMAAGTPVVTTRLGGMVDMVDDGVSGLLVDPGSVEQLSAALARLGADAALRTEMSAAARTRVRSFTASAVIDRLEQIYAEQLAAFR